MTPALPEISAMDRLRWLVGRAFGVLPGSVPLSDAEWLVCGTNLLLDRRQGAAASENPGFDPRRFDVLRGSGA